MNKTKAVSLLLSVALLLSIVIPGTLALQAFATGTQGDSGMVIDKTAQKNGDGSYTITLEATPPAVRSQQKPKPMYLRILFWCWISPAP